MRQGPTRNPSNAGSPACPSPIRAATRGGASITSGVVRLQGANRVTIEGLTITTSGAAISVDGGTHKVAVSFESSNDCRHTRIDHHNDFHGTNPGLVLGGGSLMRPGSGRAFVPDFTAKH